MKKPNLIPIHGNYKNLLSYKSAVIVYDYTVGFCEEYIRPNKTYRTDKSYRSYRTADQMVQAARSGCQNIVEASQASGTSKKVELKLVGVARASQAELLADYEAFLRQTGLAQWNKEDARAREIRQLAYRSNRSYKTYKPYLLSPEPAANCAIVLINQTTYLLDKQLAALENQFLEHGGFTERLYRARKAQRGY